MKLSLPSAGTAIKWDETRSCSNGEVRSVNHHFDLLESHCNAESTVVAHYASHCAVATQRECVIEEGAAVGHHQEHLNRSAEGKGYLRKEEKTTRAYIVAGAAEVFKAPVQAPDGDHLLDGEPLRPPGLDLCPK